MIQSASVPRLGGRDAMIPDKEAAPGSQRGSHRGERLSRQADESGQAGGDHASSRTDPDDAERDTGNYGSEGWGFESLRARQQTTRLQARPRVAVPSSYRGFESYQRADQVRWRCRD
jgi:hypothetical protein